VAIIGGEPARFAPLVQLYRDAAREGGRDPSTLAVGINSHTYVAETSERAAAEFYPAYAAMMNRIGRERGWPPMTREQFDRGRAPGGHLMVGSPQEVADKILAQHELFGHDRFLAQMSLGNLAHEHALRSTELLGAEVAPRVRAEVARRAAAAA
jgi:alkanesulfonate monooxygenase SsuD/methylene tetrahydromethanopterin reductase-like flavin-dependent oxidoreductase (luciferase family)